MEDVKNTQSNEVKNDVKNDGTTNEENQSKTYTEEEVKALLAETKKNAIAEGMRKASKNQEASNNEELEKLNASLSEKDNLLTEKDTKLNELNAELTAIKQVNKMNDLGIDKKYHEDIFALLKGKNMEITEENITEIAEAHPEWKVDADFGIGSMGVVRHDNDAYAEAQLKEQEEIKKKFQL